jgi:hypothetical protein
MCKPLPTYTTGEDIFNLIHLHAAEKSLTRKQRVDICIDGARSMVGKMCGFLAHVKSLHHNAIIATVSFIFNLML